MLWEAVQAMGPLAQTQDAPRPSPSLRAVSWSHARHSSPRAGLCVGRPPSTPSLLSPSTRFTGREMPPPALRLEHPPHLCRPRPHPTFPGEPARSPDPVLRAVTPDDEHPPPRQPAFDHRRLCALRGRGHVLPRVFLTSFPPGGSRRHGPLYFIYRGVMEGPKKSCSSTNYRQENMANLQCCVPDIFQRNPSFYSLFPAAKEKRKAVTNPTKQETAPSPLWAALSSLGNGVRERERSRPEDSGSGSSSGRRASIFPGGECGAHRPPGAA